MEVTSMTTAKTTAVNSPRSLPHNVSVLVVGDVILDEYKRGISTRPPLEEGVPVLALRTSEVAGGGAANVALNLILLGATVSLIGALGEDSEGETLLRLLSNAGVRVGDIQRTSRRPTTHKLRVLSQAGNIVRVDREVTNPLTTDEETTALAAVRRQRHDLDGIILSDYRKGFLTDRLIRDIIVEAGDHNIPVLVDSKRRDYTHFKHAEILKPNLNELKLATSMDVSTPESLDQATRSLMRSTAARAILVTCGKDGIILYESDRKTHLRTPISRIADVDGGGDSVIATLAWAFCGGVDLLEATRLASKAGSIAVTKKGTATVSRDELFHDGDAMITANTNGAHTRNEVIQGVNDTSSNIESKSLKILALGPLLARLKNLRSQGLQIAFTNGCFDLLHAGHVDSLQRTKALGDILVVAINSDASIKKLKGPQRPLVRESQRASMLAELMCVDFVIVFDDATPLALVEAIEPDVLTKGIEYEGREVVGREVVERRGGDVVLLPYVDGLSTTALVQKIVDRYRNP
jgi:D-beta-D-heptose 7-phosphate kinase / D-beta-D-heptose 1-phosphate adenosyltransferase